MSAAATRAKMASQQGGFLLGATTLPAWLPGVGAGAGAGAGAERSRPRSALGDDGDSNDKLCRCLRLRLRLWRQLLSAFN